MSSLTRSPLKVISLIGFLIVLVLVSFWITLQMLQSSGITIAEATYGSNCNVPSGNLTKATADQCDKTPKCTFTVDSSKSGDPAPGCAKEFSVQWRCAGAPAVQRASIPAEAAGKTVEIACEQP
jgi:hypothetical protein